MEKLLLLNLIAVSLFFSSCGNIQTPQPKELTEGKYVPGYAILLATSAHSTGIAKIDANDHLLRGVTYQYDNNYQFNVYDDIYFKIKEVNGVQMAYDIKTDKTGLDILELSDIRNIANNLSMNLHNAVYKGFAHSENQLHKWGHIYDNDQTLFRYEQKEDEMESPQEIEIDGKTYKKVLFCTDEERKDCDFFYLSKDLEEKLNKLREENGLDKKLYLQGAPILHNEYMINLILDISVEHVHFGDRKQFKPQDGN